MPGKNRESTGRSPGLLDKVRSIGSRVTYTAYGGPEGHCSLGSFQKAWLPLPETLEQSSCLDDQTDDSLSHKFLQYRDTPLQIHSCEIQAGFHVVATSGYVLAPPDRFRKGPYLRWELPAGENAYLLNVEHPDPAPIPEH